MIISIRTDQPEAEIALFSADGQELETFTWFAHRELSKNLLAQIKDMLARHGKDFKYLTGVIVFEGPGSFTGLRIGITVANSLAYGLKIPVIGARTDDWRTKGLAGLKNGNNNRIVLPHYGAEAHITMPRK